ncbi:MAG: hypothetical protein HY328_12205 [Chloroflexi bacterium]|nr:hypothetical protein [Chloroflexota bacterium]
MKRILPALFVVVALLIVAALVVRFNNYTIQQPPTTLNIRPTLLIAENETARSPLPTPLPTATASALDNIRLGEPRVVFTHSSAIGVIEWLPNSQEVLLTLQQPDVLTETIETLNITSGQRRLLAARASEPSRPIWLGKADRLAYSMRPNPEEVVYELRFSGPSDDQSSQRPEGVDRIAPTISGRGDRLLIVHNGQVRVLRIGPNDQSTEESVIDLKDAGFDPDNWRTRFRSEWSSSGDKVALYDTQGFAILDLQSGLLRRYGLGEEQSEAYGYGPRWVYDARWSPDGERIALITTVGETDGTSLAYSDLTILNTSTGDFANQKIGRFVTDVAWLPDGYLLAVLAVLGIDQVGVERQGLFLADGMTSTAGHQLEFRQITSDYDFGGTWGMSLAWTSNRSMLIVPCPRRLQQNPPIVEARLCTIPADIKTRQENP